jgi:stearoyl-CoA 9-desaturase NADPH oxidoreductase
LPCGSIVEISQPQGEFVLKASPNPVLLLASGSGISAIYALLKQALKNQVPQIDLIYFSRDNAYHAEFKSLALTHPGFQYHAINTLEQPQHLDLALLEALTPHFRRSDSYACGAAAMLQSVKHIYAELGISQHLSTEYFQQVADESLASQPVKFILSQQDFIASTNLLSSAEQAGLKPKSGCRAGICNTCSCTKISGSVKNLITGEIDHSNNSQIKLCISQAISPVEIHL